MKDRKERHSPTEQSNEKDRKKTDFLRSILRMPKKEGGETRRPPHDDPKEPVRHDSGSEACPDQDELAHTCRTHTTGTECQSEQVDSHVSRALEPKTKVLG